MSAVFLASMGAAQQTPRINPGGIVSNDSRQRSPITPGLEVSVYGRHLGPAAGCTVPNRQAVTELCGTTATVGGVPAGLLYVEDHQINLRIPFNVPTEGDVPFVVTRAGGASPAVTARFAAYPASIKVTGPVRVDMPVWIEVELPERLRSSLRYPMRIRPTDFGGHWLEVRRNGHDFNPSLPKRTMPGMGGGLGGYGTVGTGGLIGLPHQPRNPNRLPLHLIYRLDHPGRYEIRYIGYDFRSTRKHVLVRSPWISLEVKPPDRGIRQAWLESMRRNEPTDPVEWLSDYLPSALASPGAEALPFVRKGLYHSNNLVREYARDSLSLFDDALLIDGIPAIIREQGPTPELAYLVSWWRPLFQPHSHNLAQSLLPWRESGSRLQTAGSLETLHFMRAHYDWSAHPGVPERMDQAVAVAFPRLLETHDVLVLQPLALYLGTWKSETAKTLLRRLIVEGTVREQAEICLRSTQFRK
ncbi:MAG: hypothetical protein U0Q16_34980 [Bryobacteraceae bacterium]